MIDDPRNPGEPRLPDEPGDDARDERLAARLQTDPLDDVTRARLVRNAMAASEHEVAPAAAEARRLSARVRWLAVAAVVVALLAVGVAVLARDDSGSGPTAARAPKAAEPQSGTAVAPNAPLGRAQLDQPFSGSSAVQTLGNLGDVGKKAELRRAVTDVLSSSEPAPAAADQAGTTANAGQAESQSSTACGAAELAQLGRTIAIGTGTVAGAPVTVYVVERSNGDRVAVVVDGACTVGAPVGL